jgi:hypothetical protein
MTKLPDKTRLNQTKNGALSVEQSIAVDLLILGKNDQATADLVGVTRQTICEWRRREPVFVAELEARRAALFAEQLARLRVLADQAIDVLGEDLQQGDDLRLRQAAAVHILKSIGLYGCEAPQERGLDAIRLDLLDKS